VGFMTHGLPFPQGFPALRYDPAGWSVEFDLWAKEALDRGALSMSNELQSARSRDAIRASNGQAVFAPIFIALGAAAEPQTPRTCHHD
jgi:4,5-DOPA dioxygenase extradiol